VSSRYPWQQNSGYPPLGSLTIPSCWSNLLDSTYCSSNKHVSTPMAVMGEQAAAKVVDDGTTVFMRTQRYGAELSRKQFSLLIAAIALGTLLECEYGSSLSARHGACTASRQRCMPAAGATFTCWAARETFTSKPASTGTWMAPSLIT
jgi:hypothetical protein